MHDLVTLGETMIRLSPPVPQRIEQAVAFEINVGGAESNVAVAAARMGHSAAWLSRLPENALGERIATFLRAQGVDVSGIAWAPGERVGTYFVEYGKRPRPIHVLYDRADSAMSRMREEDVAWDLVENARIVHCTGITPALSPSCARVTAEVMRRGRAAGALISFDVNYRALLWPPERAGAALEPYCRRADVVLGAWRDMQTLFGAEGDPPEAIQRLRQGWGCEVLILTLGDEGAIGCDASGVVQAPAFEVEIVDRLGAGDAFDAGYLVAHLEGRPLADRLCFGVALAALTMTIPSDLALVSRDEVEALLARGEMGIQR
jgi:2-dehydro-3-deoxygluconokinase